MLKRIEAGGLSSMLQHLEFDVNSATDGGIGLIYSYGHRWKAPFRSSPSNDILP